MGLRLLAPVAGDADSGVDQTARDMAANARTMILNRDAKLNQASTDAADAVTKFDSLEALADDYQQALSASVADRQALHEADEALSQRIDSIELTPGPAGPQGATGDRGPAGAVGAQGPQGVAGQAGKDGSNGQAGADGKSAYQVARDGGYGGTQAQWLVSLKGETGVAGPQGIQGLQGLTGATGSQGPQGAKGDTGATGATGAQGAAGAVGATGPAGPANLSIGSATIVALLATGSATLTIPLSKPMPSTNYSLEIAHSAVVSLANVTFTNIVKTTTSVQVKVTAVGLALAAGTVTVAAYGG